MHQKTHYYYLLLLLALPFGTLAASACPEWLAKVVSVQGKVETQHPEAPDWNPINTNDTFCYGDKIRTANHSRATLAFRNNGPRVSLAENSTLTFIPPAKKQTSWIVDLIEGSAFFRSRESQRLEVHSPFINLVHEGTEFLVTVDQQQTEISVFDGRVAASNQQGKIHIDKGFIGIAHKNQAPEVQALTIRPVDAVQWTLYYPPIVDYQSFASSNDTSLQASVKAYRQGNSHQALALLEQIPATRQNADYLTLRASLLLTVGSVDEALGLIDQALVQKSDNSSALALQSIIAVTKNRQDKALNLAQKAVAQNPQSSVAQIALSYAHQSQFDVESALKATQEAVRLAPDNALAWARLSELQLSTGEREDALASAQKAQQLNPALGRTQTILGFAYLAQVDIDEAKTVFIKAMELDSADPLAHLGLGLAKIRKGAIEEGASDLETAVSLDPDNAIMRSYLGKAYYELRNDGYAETELAIAKEMDPNDPTPWFYDAIRKQTTNRPVEALHDMQKAIALNDNRGVYRSKLLLDEDAAARSANMARIYNDLGFGRVALKQAWNALDYDSTNPSAHRFLSDSYIGQPRFRTARASELLQAQLLQPINITPVQPQLTSENVGILNSTGPGSLAVNEYDPLYNANGAHVVLNGTYGSNNTIADNAIISGIYDKLSMSLGQFHYQTDGFRKNDDYQQNIYDVFVQYAFSPDFNVQLELKSEHVRAGDLPLRLNAFHLENHREKIEHNTARIGGPYKISPEHDIIASFFYTKRKDSIDDEFSSPGRDGIDGSIDDEGNISKFSTENKGHQTEIQYIYHPGPFDITAGFGYLKLRNKSLFNNVNSLINAADPDPLTDFEQTVSKTHHLNGYIYSRLHLLPSLTTILGISYDSLKNSLSNFNSITTFSDGFTIPFRDSPKLFNKRQFNPKFGVIWNPLKNLTLRGAAFRTLKRQLAANQTIEPTQVAGFNQFFDENNGTTAWNYALGLDYNPLNSLFVGGEVSWRDTKHPVTINGVLTQRNQNESSHLAYVYWTPIEWASFSTEYRFERTSRDFEFGSGNALLAQSVATHQVPVSLNLFHNNGLFAKISTAYVNQKVSSVTDNAGLDSQNEDFWTVDTSLGFRFPKKTGVISFEVRNLFDNQFNYQSTFDASGPQLSPYIPERQFYVNLNLFY